MGARRKLNRRQMVSRMLAAPCLLAGCGRVAALPSVPESPPPTLLATRIPEATASPPMVVPAATSTDTGWLRGDDGIELRRLRIAPAPEVSAPIVIARVDPRLVRLRVVYRPDTPVALRAWFAAERPLLAVNGGYFNADYSSSSLVISDGVASGDSYSGFGGMLAAYADNTVELRALRDMPYDAAEPIIQATQSAPMLVFPGGVAAQVQHNGERARRTIVAFDTIGNLLLIVAPTSTLSLGDAEDWLVESDLQIDRALNFDGGSSSGMFVASGSIQESIDSFGALPIVVLIHRQTY
jgi:uncharacterized protein YigE (DUF2233 family)